MFLFVSKLSINNKRCCRLRVSHIPVRAQSVLNNTQLILLQVPPDNIEYDSGEFQRPSNIIKSRFWIRNVQPNGFNPAINCTIYILLLIVNKNDGFK